MLERYTRKYLRDRPPGGPISEAEIVDVLQHCALRPPPAMVGPIFRLALMVDLIDRLAELTMEGEECGYDDEKTWDLNGARQELMPAISDARRIVKLRNS